MNEIMKKRSLKSSFSVLTAATLAPLSLFIFHRPIIFFRSPLARSFKFYEPNLPSNRKQLYSWDYTYLLQIQAKN